MKLNNYTKLDKIVIAMTFFGVLGYRFLGNNIVSFTPYYLIITMFVLWTSWRTEVHLKKMWLISGAIGLLSEYVGINTGILFGDYTYGTVLGMKVAGVPLLIGILWALVTTAIWAQLPIKWGSKRILALALIAVIYDVALEHFAVRFGLWQWVGVIPFTNALGWGLVSGSIGFVFHKLNYRLHRSKISMIVLPLQTVFFLALLLL